MGRKSETFAGVDWKQEKGHQLFSKINCS